jgi:hypothetical protein
VMFGDGLSWDESVPAQVGAMLGTQSVNLAVHGFSTDQSYLRLASELPRFHSPVALVTLFMTAIFGRNLDEDRPHLGPGLIWLPPRSYARLSALGHVLVPFRRESTVDRGIAVTRDVFRAIDDLARRRHAASLIVVPQLGPESGAQRALRRRILDEARIPYLFVEVGGDWRLPRNLHPNAHAAHTVALEVADRLRVLTAARNPL